MLPTLSIKPGQLVPNWKLMAMPETTPMAKVQREDLDPELVEAEPDFLAGPQMLRLEENEEGRQGRS